MSLESVPCRGRDTPLRIRLIEVGETSILSASVWPVTALRSIKVRRASPSKFRDVGVKFDIFAGTGVTEFGFIGKISEIIPFETLRS